LGGEENPNFVVFKQYPKETLSQVWFTVHNILSRNGLMLNHKSEAERKPVFPIFDPKKVQ